jgi:hypothetical protein
MAAVGLRSAFQSLVSARLDHGSDRTFRRVSTAIGRGADLLWAGLDRRVVTQRGHCRQRIGVRHKRDFSGAVVRWFTPKADRAVIIILYLA